MLGAFQYRPFGAPAPLSDRIWSDPFFIGFFYNVIRFWSRVHLGREPEVKEFSRIFGDTIYELGKSSNSATAALTTLKAFASAGPESDFIKGATIGWKFVQIIEGDARYDEDEDVQAAKQAAIAVRGHESITSGDVAGIYLDLFVRREYIARFDNYEDAG